MGPRKEAQPAMFCGFSLEDHVPHDHLLRAIGRFVDLTGIRVYLADFYSHTGRPSVDPELLIRMLLVGYCFGIRSERRLCEEVHLNLAYRWFCRLDLSDRVPDHSTYSKNRPFRQIASQSPAGQFMAGFAIANCCGISSRQPSRGVSRRVWSAVSAWPSTRAGRSGKPRLDRPGPCWSG